MTSKNLQVPSTSNQELISSVMSTNFPLSIPSNSRRTKPQNNYKRTEAWQIAPNLQVSFKYAWAGVRYAFLTQRNFRIHTFIGIVAVSASCLLGIAPVEISIVTLTCALVMVLELLNTALESVVDLTVGQSYHELAKIAKDCAAGAVLISAIAALLVAACIILPPLFAIII